MIFMNNQMKRLMFLAHFGQLKHESWYLVSEVFLLQLLKLVFKPNSLKKRFKKSSTKFSICDYILYIYIYKIKDKWLLLEVFHLLKYVKNNIIKLIN